MVRVNVKTSGLGHSWSHACQRAANDLNVLFNRNRIGVHLVLSGSQGPTISVQIDPHIQGTLVHGNTTSRFGSSGGFLGADVRLPTRITINTPRGPRDAGAGILEVVAAHEFVHALGHDGHNSHLMAQTMQKEMGDSPWGDKLKANDVLMPPLQLSMQSILTLRRNFP
jgi:hypothetical protein